MKMIQSINNLQATILGRCDGSDDSGIHHPVQHSGIFKPTQWLWLMLIKLCMPTLLLADHMPDQWPTQLSIDELIETEADRLKRLGTGELSAVAVDIHGVVIDGVRQPYKTYRHSPADFDDAQIIGEHPIENLRPQVLAWSADGQTLYGFHRADNPNLISIDPLTGVTTDLGPLSGYGSGVQLSGMAITEKNTCYIIATDNNNHDTVTTLYVCNLETGVLTPIGTQSTAPDIHDIAATCDGRLLGVDSFTKTLYEVDSEDGSASLIGPLGFPDDFMFSLTYDRSSGVLYQYLLDDSGHFTALATVSQVTGQATQVTGGYNFGHYVGAIESVCVDPIFQSGFEP
jgi:hypothetical protein